MTLSREEQSLLLNIAGDSVNYGIKFHREIDLNLDHFPPSLHINGATFVTVKLQGKLRGCIGQLDPIRPLALDVSHNAFHAAFRDPRFPPLSADESPHCSISISLLSPLEKLPAGLGEEALLDLLQENIHGLVLEEHGRRATFLPSVWKIIPDRREFLQRLRGKAGFDEQHHSSTANYFRYTTFTWPDE